MVGCGKADRGDVTVVTAEQRTNGWGLRAPLEALGYRVLGHAADVETALSLVRRLTPSLVILDLDLPGLNGLRAAEAIQFERRSALVFLASQWDPASLEAAVGLGAVACLGLPLGVEQLALSLRMALAVDAEIVALRRAQAEQAAKLATVKLVARAKGILMRRLDLGEAQAHLLLHHRARQTRRPLAAVSEEVVAADRFFAELEKSPCDLAQTQVVPTPGSGPLTAPQSPRAQMETRSVQPQGQQEVR